MTRRRLDYKTIGRNIRSMRLEHGWTQKKLAEEARLSEASVSKMERGIGGMKVETFFKLSKALGCKAADILKGAE